MFRSPSTKPTPKPTDNTEIHSRAPRKPLNLKDLFQCYPYISVSASPTKHTRKCTDNTEIHSRAPRKPLNLKDLFLCYPCISVSATQPSPTPILPLIKQIYRKNPFPNNTTAD